MKSIISQSGLSIKLGAANALGSDLTGGLGAFYKSYSKLPIGQAVIATINKGIFALVKQIGAEPVKGVVSRVKGGRIYLNLGQGRVRVGDRLKVVSKGEKVVDPTTGEVLGSEDETVGHVVVRKVFKRFSIARASGPIKGRIKVRDEVVSTRAPEPLRFAGSWTGPGGGSSSSSGSSGSSSNGGDDDEDEGD